MKIDSEYGIHDRRPDNLSGNRRHLEGLSEPLPACHVRAHRIEKPSDEKRSPPRRSKLLFLCSRQVKLAPFFRLSIQEEG